MNIKLLQGLGQGHHEAYDELIRQYYPRLMGYARVLLCEEDARDIVQEVFLYIWEQHSRLKFTPGLEAYLFRICHSRMIDHLKRNKLLSESNLPLNQQFSCDIKWLEANSDDIVGSLCDKDLINRILAMTDELHEKRREVFRLSILHEMSNAEIAQLLNIPQRTVEGHLYHALRFLRQRISREELLTLMMLVTISM